MPAVVSAAVKKAVVAAWQAGTHNFGAIATAVKKATGRAIRFPAIGAVLSTVRKAKPWKRRKAKAKRGPGRPPKKAKRGPGRPRKKGRRGPGRPKGAGKGAPFVLALPRGRGAKYLPFATAATLKSRLKRLADRGGDVDRVLVYARKKVKIARSIKVTL